tara:strand:+ start:794 stop:1177 length:384 start_codon:yes stop_codon:yes gene_type:complete
MSKIIVDALENAAGTNTVNVGDLGGAADVSGGVGSSGVQVTATSIPPIGCLMFAHNGDSKVAAKSAKFVYYGRQFTAANASNNLRCYAANSGQTGSVALDIRTGTWRVLSTTFNSGGDGSLIFQRIA